MLDTGGKRHLCVCCVGWLRFITCLTGYQHAARRSFLARSNSFSHRTAFSEVGDSVKGAQTGGKVSKLIQEKSVESSVENDLLECHD